MGIDLEKAQECEIDACILYDRVEDELGVTQEEIVHPYGTHIAQAVRCAIASVLRSKGYSWPMIASAMGSEHASDPFRADRRIRQRFREGRPREEDILAMCVCRGALP